jgi:hypothetical protein
MPSEKQIVQEGVKGKPLLLKEDEGLSADREKTPMRSLSLWKCLVLLNVFLKILFFFGIF